MPTRWTQGDTTSACTPPTSSPVPPSARLDVTYATSAMHLVVRELELDDFRCGRYVDLYQDGPRRFRYFDAIHGTPTLDEHGTSPCATTCEYRHGCALPNKLASTAPPAS